MQVRFKKLHPEALTPKYGTNGAACFDLACVGVPIIAEEESYGYIEYRTGLAFEIPEGYVGLLYPRSSISKTGLILANSVGVIDSDYRGEVTARFKWRSGTGVYSPGDRIVQMMIIPIPKIELVEVEELTDTERGSGGYGSTGR